MSSQIQPALRNVTVIGAGPLGRRLAELCCRAGFTTTLEDVLPANLRSARAELDAELHAELHFAATVAEAVREADLVLDSLPDEFESKLEIFSMVDRMAPPRTIMLTPTSTYSIADLASCTYRGERCFSFEVPEGFLAREAAGVLRVVETKETLPEISTLVRDFWERCGLVVEITVDPARLPKAALR